MQNNVWVWVVVAVVILGGAFLLFQSSTGTNVTITPTPTPTTPSPTPTPSTSTSTPSAPMSATITYDGKAFSPATVTIKVGGKVTWNSSVDTMEVASAAHPTHSVYDGTNRAQHCAAPSATTFDQCKGGKTFSFTFTKAGSWNYHDHENATAFGKVVVE